MEETIVFARVGWMPKYTYSTEPEPGPVGGGKHNVTGIGWEKDNFRLEDGRYFGYFAVGSGTQSINLFRADGVTREKSVEQIKGVLLVFVAKQPDSRKRPGQYVVGWYRNAVLYRDQHANHDRSRVYRADTDDAVCVKENLRNCRIPGAKPGPGIGQSNIYYTRDWDGKKKELSWLASVVEYVSNFRDESQSSSQAHSLEAAEIAEEGKAGFQSNPLIRKAVEHRAMEVVRQHYAHLRLVDTSQTEPYDFRYLDGEVHRFIEVKGSQAPDPKIILTSNEVDFARANSDRIDLCVVHSIVVSRGPDLKATAGIMVQFSPWFPDRHQLKAIQFRCSPTWELGTTGA